MVSVILPNYNHSAFLRERIDSILNQTYQEFELIILDDKSSDNSKDIIEEYRGDSRISHIIYNEKNSGSTFVQWKKGFTLAKGEYIWIAESDDYADVSFLERCVEQLDNNPEAVFCYSDSYFVNEHSQQFDCKPLNHVTDVSTNGPSIVFNGTDYIKRNLMQYNKVYNASMVVFRKSNLQNISDVYTRFRYCGDWLFWAEMANFGSVIRIPTKLNYFRQHTNKVSAKGKGDSLSIFESQFIILYLLSMCYDLIYWQNARISTVEISVKSIILYVKPLFKGKIEPKVKFYQIGRLYNYLRKTKHITSNKERAELMREINFVWYASIAGFLIKNSKSLSRYLMR